MTDVDPAYEATGVRESGGPNPSGGTRGADGPDAAGARAAAVVAPAPGRTVQLDPLKPMLEALGTESLKQQYDESPSNLAFNSTCVATARAPLRSWCWCTRRARRRAAAACGASAVLR